MALWREKTVVAATNGVLKGANFQSNGVAIHTDLVKKGDIFFALTGEKTDGHAFLHQAYTKGAVAAVVNRLDPGDEKIPLTYIVVPNVEQALLQAAQYARAHLTNPKVIAVTGSVGKTTTRQMIAHSLRSYGTVFTSQKNYNTLIGVSVDLCNCPRDVDYLVLEVGMNHPGEILPTTQLIQPDSSLITKIAENHLEFFDSIEAIAHEKAQVLVGLKKTGCAVLPLDSPYFEILKEQAGLNSQLTYITFSHQNSDADVSLCQENEIKTLKCGPKTYPFFLQEIGQHYEENALAVVAVLQALSLPLEQGIHALRSYSAEAARGAVHHLMIHQKHAAKAIQITLIDESYNASYTSTKAALARLGLMPALGRKVFIFGDMLELGQHAREWHIKLLPAIFDAKIDLAFFCGSFSRELYELLPDPMKGAWAENSHVLFQQLSDRFQAGDLILIKGSFGSRMQSIVERINRMKVTKESDVI